MAEVFQAARTRLCTALTDKDSTVGTKVGTGQFVMGGNMAMSDPAFSPVYADDLGRLWVERHQGADHEIICIHDLRKKA